MQFQNIQTNDANTGRSAVLTPKEQNSYLTTFPEWKKVQIMEKLREVDMPLLATPVAHG